MAEEKKETLPKIEDKNPGVSNAETSKTFTQEDVDKFISERLTREAKKYEGLGEKAKKYDEYLETQKTEEQKRLEELEKIKQERDNFAIEKENTKRELAIAKMGANDPDYVLFKVSKMVTNELSFEQALQKFKAENEQYFLMNNPRKVSTGKSVSGYQTEGNKPGWLSILEKKEGIKLE